MQSNSPASGPSSESRVALAALVDVKQLGFFAAITSLGYVFWIVGAMEMVERLAFYGVKALAALYAKAPAIEGGLGITMTEFGIINGVWAGVQSFLPVFTGALSDRYGYKRTIFVSTLVKIAGYLTMAAFRSFYGFLLGAVLLAAGTAIFKPGIQGTLIKASRRENSSVAWGIFYQTVNIGGFIGPLVAGSMRKLEWQYVFLSCALAICMNFVLLLTYREPGRVAGAPVTAASSGVLRDALRELRRPHVWRYLLIFTGFWFMFNTLFDVLPAHIDDWVDTRDLVRVLKGEGELGPWAAFFIVLSPDGQRIQPEGMVNLNAGLIMITCFLFGWLSGLMRATTSLAVGCLVSSVALLLCGCFSAGFVVAFGILVFSVGEMLSSPKFSEYIGNFAPDDKKAMYVGFSQIPLGIGWTLEGFLGPMLYDVFASKDRFARELLVERGMAAAEAAAIPEGEAFSRLVRVTGESPEALTQLLHQSHSVGLVWVLFAGVGLLSALGIASYARWLRKQVGAA
jgi:MFS family permease